MAAQQIDAYLAELEEPERATLEEVRRRILEVIPDAEQCLSYSMPAFKVDGQTIAGLAAFNNHLSYLPHSGSVLSELGEEVSGYEQTKGSLHFAVDAPLPRHLVNSLIRAKMRQCGLLEP